MTLLEKMDLLIKSAGLNKHTFAEKSGVPYTTIVSLYKVGFENMRISTLKTICSFFGVTLDSMIFDDMDLEYVPENTSSFSAANSLISVDEYELVAAYRSASPAIRNAVRRVLGLKEVGSVSSVDSGIA